MKTILSFVVLGFSLVALTGCYTRMVTSDSYSYEEPETIIVIVPPPTHPDWYPPPTPPVVDPAPPYYTNPPQEKVRKPETPTRPSYGGNVRDDLRGSGSRNNNTDKRDR